MNNETDTEVVKSEDVVEEAEVSEETDYKAKFEAAEAARKEEAARRKRAEAKLERDRIKDVVEDKVEKVLEKKTGELDDTQLDYLDLKGITEDEDIDVIKSVMKRTGQSLRQVLKDDYVVEKLGKLKQAREVTAATPTASRRSGQGETNELAYWISENERTGKLPDDFETRMKVIEAKEKKAGNSNLPPWRR